ncbi:MAG: hypothetical protein AUG75_11860 [Cyanobacteria bacterium 13_1_20CM_4_61_6]|nr:MAG: hypothetical protein AUG75_11860 [Cyanobacteria bacterium 13_1_20CM_4_61_6]
MKYQPYSALLNRKILAVFAFAFFFYACGSRSFEPSRHELTPITGHQGTPSPMPMPQQPETTVGEFLRNQFDPLEEQERPAILRSWGKIPHQENYHVGQHDYGEIAGAYGLALFVMDKTVTTSKNCSLLVFIRRPRNRYDLYWIYRNEDLSQLSLSRASGDIFVSGIREDGTNVNCEIAWSRKDNRWTCLSF